MRLKYFRSMILMVACVSLAVAFARCSSGAASNPLFVLANLSDNMILPAYENFSASAADLETAVQDLCLSPTAQSLANAQAAWKEAHANLKETEVIAFGPYKDSNFAQRIDFWPTRTNNIENAVTNNSTFDDSVIASLGVSARGIPALEYLLFGSGNSSTTLNALKAESGKRCRFVEAVSRDLANQSLNLYAAWSPLDGNFSASLSEPGSPASPFPNTQNAISVLVNQMGYIVELVRDTKLGKPLGKNNGGDIQPGLVESPYSGSSAQGMIHNLRGLQLLYHSGPKADPEVESIYSLVYEKDTFTANYLDIVINETIDALEQIPEPFQKSLETDTAAAEKAYEKLRIVKAQISGPISGLLGITAFFNGNDGD